MALANFGDLFRTNEHAFDLCGLIGTAHPALDAQIGVTGGARARQGGHESLTGNRVSGWGAVIPPDLQRFEGGTMPSTEADRGQYRHAGLRLAVQGYFYGWRDSGRWQNIATALVERARCALGRTSKPTTAVIDKPERFDRRHQRAARL